MKVEDLTATNPMYNANAVKWEFFLRSFSGGDEYRGGNYLLKYIKESDAEYEKRIDLTPLDNHCKNVINIYSSFIWRLPPTRNFGSQDNDPIIQQFLNDADMDGRNFNSFMRDAQAWSGVYGHVWVLVDKPKSEAVNKAQELVDEVRPYVTLITPENVLDWRYERGSNGRYQLTMLKVREWASADESFYRVWGQDEIASYHVKGDEAELVEVVDNPLGKVPAVCLYANRSPVRGIGISDITDVAYMQKAIYNELSEIEQLIRITNHPSLVMGQNTDASAGAGGVIVADDSEEIKPYLLQPNGGNLDAIRASITDKVEAINRMTHMGAVRATEAQTKSGVALQTEFQLLNAKLSEKADLLELAEEQVWDLFSQWQEANNDIEVDYPDSFNLRDYGTELEFLQRARASGVSSTTFNQGVDKAIAELVLGDEDLVAAINEIETSVVAAGQYNDDAQIFKYHIDSGVVTRNEAREGLGLDPVSGGDKPVEPYGQTTSEAV